MKDSAAEAARWLKQAQYDLKAAKYNAEGQFYATACFSAQQSAEKALKAFLFRQAEVYDEQDAEGAIALATEVLKLVEQYLGAQ